MTRNIYFSLREKDKKMHVYQTASRLHLGFPKSFLTTVLLTLRKLGHQTMNPMTDFFLAGDNFEECLETLQDTTYYQNQVFK